MDTDQDIFLIQETLKKQLDHLRPRPRVIVEESPECEGNIHIYVASRYFSGMLQHKREELVWEVLTKDLSWEVVKNVTRLHVWTDRELKQWLSATEEIDRQEAAPKATATAAL